MTSAAGGASEADYEPYADWLTGEYRDGWEPMAIQPVTPKKSAHAGPNPPPNMAHTDEGLPEELTQLDYWSPDVKFASDFEVVHVPSRTVLDEALEANALEGWFTRSWTAADGITRVEKVAAAIRIRRKRI